MSGRHIRDGMEDSLDERLRKGKLLGARDKTSTDPYSAEMGQGLGKRGYWLTVRPDGTHVISTPTGEIELPPVIAQSSEAQAFAVCDLTP
jgi:hypothetical protein